MENDLNKFEFQAASPTRNGNDPITEADLINFKESIIHCLNNSHDSVMKSLSKLQLEIQDFHQELSESFENLRRASSKLTATLEKNNAQYAQAIERMKARFNL